MKQLYQMIKLCKNWDPFFIRALKDRVDYEQQTVYYKKNHHFVYDLQFLQQNMFVLPVPFAKEHKHMLAHFNDLLEYTSSLAAILTVSYTISVRSLRSTQVYSSLCLLDYPPGGNECPGLYL